MKTSAIIRIVIYMLLLAMLVGLLGLGLHWYRTGTWDGLFSFGGFSYPDSDRYQVGSASLPAQALTELEINWIAGSVTLQVTDGDSISFREPQGLDQENQLRYLVSGNRLILQYRKSGWAWGNIPGKDLTVEIPRSMLDRLTLVKLDTTSAHITARGLQAGTVEIDAVSGPAVLEDCRFDSLEMDTVSGGLRFSGFLDRLEFEAVSGDAQLAFGAVPQSLSFDAVSGRCSMTLPQDAAFSASLDSVSGDFTSGFPISKQGDTYYCGTGGGSFRFDTVSGDITINPAGTP